MENVNQLPLRHPNLIVEKPKPTGELSIVEREGGGSEKGGPRVGGRLGGGRAC